MDDVTRLLLAIDQGDPQAAGDLLPLVYEELRKLAIQKMAREHPGQTLQPTALIHDAYLRLVTSQGKDQSAVPKWNSRGHFYSAAAEAMRRILVEGARRKKRLKHGGGKSPQSLKDGDPAGELSAVSKLEKDEEILALNDALGELEKEDPFAAKVVNLHFFAGLSIDEVGETLGVSRATAYRHWSYARAWLRCAMGSEPSRTEGK